MKVARSPTDVLAEAFCMYLKIGSPMVKAPQVGERSCDQSLLFPLSGGHVNYSHEDPGIGSHNDPQGQQHHDYTASIDEVLEEGCVCTREVQQGGKLTEEVVHLTEPQ